MIRSVHIPDGFIDAPTSLGAGVLSTATVGVCVRRAGATLDELARCLKGRGASWVGNLVVARTPSPS